MKYLMCSVSSHGFVYPAIGIAQALRGRGHEVAFVTGQAFAGVIQAAGFERIGRGEQDGASFQIERWGVPLSTAIQVKHIEYALSRFDADVLVGQPLTLGPVIVAERRRLPLAMIGLSTFLWPGRPDAVTADSPDTAARKAWRYADIMRLLNEARALFGLAASDAPSHTSPLLGDLFLVQSVPELAGDISALPERVHLTGACLWEPPEHDAALGAWLGEARRSGQPILYIQQARSFDRPRFWSHVVAAVADTPVRVVASVGRVDGAIGAVPPNMFVRAHVPQMEVLPYAAATISSGTTTPVLGALTHGLPSILLPAGGEQHDVAEQVERAGAALLLPPDDDPATVAAAINRVLHDATLRANAQRVQHAFARYDGAEHAAECLAALGAERRLALHEAA